MKNKQLIGAKEFVSILDLQLYDLDAKIDTGADSSALHCDHITIEDDQVSFSLLDEVHPAYHGKHFTFPLFKIKKVRSSNGDLQLRPSIKVTIKVYEKSYEGVITLTNRADMKYPMLIGRKFLMNRFLVDVSQEYINNTLKD